MYYGQQNTFILNFESSKTGDEERTTRRLYTWVMKRKTEGGNRKQ